MRRRMEGDPLVNDGIGIGSRSLRLTQRTDPRGVGAISAPLDPRRAFPKLRSLDRHGNLHH